MYFQQKITVLTQVAFTDKLVAIDIKILTITNPFCIF